MCFLILKVKYLWIVQIASMPEVVPITFWMALESICVPKVQYHRQLFQKMSIGHNHKCTGWGEGGQGDICPPNSCKNSGSIQANETAEKLNYALFVSHDNQQSSIKFRQLGQKFLIREKLSLPPTPQKYWPPLVTTFYRIGKRLSESERLDLRSSNWCISVKLKVYNKLFLLVKIMVLRLDTSDT